MSGYGPRWTEWQVREGAWTILRNQKALREDGHAKVVAWAKAYVDATRRPR